MTAAGRVHPREVVPRTTGTNLDHVASHLVGAPAEPRQLVGGRGATPVRGEPRTEDIGDVHERGLLTDRAVLTKRCTDISRCAQQLGVRVADVEARQPSLPELPHHGVSCQAVLDATACSAHRKAPKRGGPETHRLRVPPSHPAKGRPRPGAQNAPRRRRSAATAPGWAGRRADVIRRAGSSPRRPASRDCPRVHGTS